MQAYTNHGPRQSRTPQNEPIPGSSQTKNNAGGYSWSVDDLTRLHRFLILGTTGGTYYVGERELTKQNLDVVERLLKAGQGKAVVREIVEISKAGRAVTNDPALFALARCAAADDVEVLQYALGVLPQIARTGTHLLHFVHFVKQFRGWGRAYKRAVARWYNDMPEQRLAYQVLKYQNRDGYRQRDVLRLSHPKPETSTYNTIYHWITKGWPAVGEEPHPDQALQLIWAFERAKVLSEPNDIADLVLRYRLPREAVPTQHLHSVKIWEALLQDMPLEAMTRNLATMTRENVLRPMGQATQEVLKRLGDQGAITRARLQPIKLLSALTTYSSGKSVRGDSTWTPLREIIDALNLAFYLAFGAVEPTGKRLLLALDTSASMRGYKVNGIPNLPVHLASAAMALVVANSEPQYHIIGVDTAVQHPPISPRQRLDDVFATLMRYGGGGTDLSLPFVYAMQSNLDVDAVIVFTDGETWAGRSHPAQALTEYRRKVGHPVKMINVQMAASHVSNNDPNDPDALECVGFDTTTPEVISGFIKGEF